MNNAKKTTLFPYLERLLEGEAVEWKTLGEVCDIVKAASKLKSGDYCVSGKVPIIDQGAQYIAGYTDKELATIPKDEYIIFGDHTETIKFVDFEFVQGADGLKILHTKKALSKYVYYAFSNFYKKTASYKRHWSKAKETSIPLPPLRVQALIVEILDKFTQLEAELEKELAAELEARKKQYAYYRDQLLNFSQYPPLNVNTKWKTLGEVCDYIRGITYNKSAETTEVDGWKVLRANNITLETRKLNFNEVKHVKKTIRVRENQMLQKGDILICAGSGSKEHIGKTAYIESDIDYTFGGFMGVLRLKEEKTISSRYLFHYIGSGAFTTYLGATLKSSTINNLNNGIISPFTIPIPPLSEQRRIVDILDRFDTLTNSISEGLPKEIALRRKQYEYYRDALLNFPRAEVTA